MVFFSWFPFLPTDDTSLRWIDDTSVNNNARDKQLWSHESYPESPSFPVASFLHFLFGVDVFDETIEFDFVAAKASTFFRMMESIIEL